MRLSERESAPDVRDDFDRFEFFEARCWPEDWQTTEQRITAIKQIWKKGQARLRVPCMKISSPSAAFSPPAHHGEIHGSA